MALELLVVLELDLEQPDQLDPDARDAGDADAGELVAAEHLVDVALHDHVPRGRPPVADHDHAALAGRGDDRGPVRQVGQRARRRPARGAGPGRRSCGVRQQLGGCDSEKVGERRGPRAQVRPGKPPSVGIRAHADPSVSTRLLVMRPYCRRRLRANAALGHWPPFCT